MQNFEYVKAESIDEVLLLLSQKQVRTKVMAGGTDLLSTLKDQIHETYPDRVVSLKTCAGLDYIEKRDDTVTIGALAGLKSIANSHLINSECRVLASAAGSVGSPQIRNMGTIGGNLCQEPRCWYYRVSPFIGDRYLCLRKGGKKCFAVSGDSRYHGVIGKQGCWAACPSDIAVALCALDAQIVVAGPEGSRKIPATDFYDGVGTVLGEAEIVVEIQIVPPADPKTQTYLKFRFRKAIDFAVASVAAVVEADRVRIALGGVAPMPLRAKQAEQLLAGIKIGEQQAQEAASVVLTDAKPLKKNGYKVPLTRTLVKRALLF